MENPIESKKWKGILGKTGRKGWFFVVSRFNYSYMIQLQFPTMTTGGSNSSKHVQGQQGQTNTSSSKGLDCPT